MLKGLEISEVSFGDVGLRTSDFRIESEYFTQELITLDRLIDSKNFVPLKDVSSKISDGTHFTPEYVSKGVPFLSAINVKSNVFDLNAGFQHITQEAHNALYRRCDPREGDVLVRKVGAGARMACVIPQLGFQFSIFVSVAMIRTKGIDPYYLSTFINTRIGQRQLLRFNKCIGQPDLHLEDLARLRIFRASCEFQSEIARVVIKANWLIESATVQYGEAEQSLLSELGLDGWTPTEESVSVKNCSDFMSAGRFDAEYFQPKYDELFTLLAKCKVRVLGGKDGLVDIKRSIEPGSDAYSDKGIPFVRIADFTEMGVASPEIHIPPELCSDSPRPKKDTILLSKDGSVGIAYKVEEDLDIVTSSGILHLTVKDNAVLPDYLTLVLNSKIVRLQAERSAGGSIIQHWKQSEVENVSIPILPMSSQQKITAKVRESFALRTESKFLLDLAKHAVEVAIEQGESKALEALEKEIGHAN